LSELQLELAFGRHCETTLPKASMKACRMAFVVCLQLASRLLQRTTNTVKLLGQRSHAVGQALGLCTDARQSNACWDGKQTTTARLALQEGNLSSCCLDTLELCRVLALQALVLLKHIGKPALQ
jgi:hypothetical protein